MQPARLLIPVLSIAVFGALGESRAEAETADARETARHHTVYVDLLGKHGLWGLNFERRVRGPWLIGIGGSSWTAGSRHTSTGVIYAGAVTPAWGSHSLFTHIGPLVVHEREPSFAELPSLSRTRLGAQLSAGYQWSPGKFFLRGYTVLSVGKGGVAPWLGTSVGVSF